MFSDVPLIEITLIVLLCLRSFSFRSSYTFTCVDIKCVIILGIQKLYKIYLLVFFTMSSLDGDQQCNPQKHHLERLKILYILSVQSNYSFAVNNSK
jgi:hypothetical protein